MEKTELFVCRCHDVCHQLVLETLETEEDEERVVYGSFHLDPLSFGDRLKNATKYILGRKRKYGDFNTLLLRPEDADRLEWFACYLDRGVAAANHAMPSHFTFHSKEYVYDLAYETSQHTLLDGSVLIDHDTWLSASMKPGNVFGLNWGGLEFLTDKERGPLNVQLFCFFLAAVHLSMAHLWKMKDSLSLRDKLGNLGWAIFLWANFFTVKCLLIDFSFEHFGPAKYLYAVGTDCWPWMWSFSDEEHSISGKKEWVMVTVVCSGESQNSPVGSTTAGAQLYLNGQLAYDSQACYSTNGESMGWEGGYTWDATLAPNIMQPGSSEFESYFGINYWDTIFKGFVDDLYVFDSALSAGQVASLYALGDPNVESVAPEAPAVEEEEAEPSVSTVEIVPDESAIDKVGAVDFSNGWWSDWSDSYAINDGETKTVTLKNYSDGINNWDNLVTAFTNTETKGHSAPADQSADYAEYAVVRSDAFGWGDASYAMTSSECSWGDDWAGWLALMTDADIKLTISRSGSELTLDYVFTGADGTEMTEKVVVASTLTADAPCYFFFTCEECYIDIISVE